jgi:ribonuclease P/MRP protein subunit POP5
MTDPKQLPPSLRDIKRYVVFEIITENHVNYKDFVEALWTSVSNFLGEAQASRAKIWVIQNLFDEKSKKGVIRCSHTYVEHTRVVLSLIQFVGEARATIRVMGVTGTIKSARIKYMGYRE